MIKSTLIIAATIVLVGCGIVPIQPRSDTFRMDLIPNFLSPIPISIINRQSDSIDRNCYDHYGIQIQASLKLWTDTAVEITKRELNKRGSVILDAEPRKLELSIISINGNSTFATFHYITKLQVVTGSGYKGIYIGDNASPATIQRAADGAVMRAVSAMFNDPEIIKYITSKKVLTNYEPKTGEIDLYKSLEKLKILFDKDIITKDEFSNKKREILQGI